MLLLLACLLAGAAEGDKTLEGGVWSLVELNGEVVQLPAAERQPYLQFQRQDCRVNGYSGCNYLFGSYELKGEMIVFGPLGMARRFCAGKAGEVEQAFLGVLAKVNIWRIEERELLLVAGNRVLARLRQEQRDTCSRQTAAFDASGRILSETHRPGISFLVKPQLICYL